MVGFDAKNKNILDKKFICPTCSMILRDPVQLVNCGHRICRSCLPEHRITVQCSQCQKETSPNDIVSDRGFLSDMESIRINCYYCEWNDVLKNYQVKYFFHFLVSLVHLIYRHISMNVMSYYVKIFMFIVC